MSAPSYSPPLTITTLADLLGAADPGRNDPGRDDAIGGASHHSGRIEPGDAFFALPGADHHGIEHADAALAAGAVVVVSDRPHPRGLLVDDPGDALLRLGRFARGRMRAPVVGITGSAGKTTARGLCAAVLQAASSHGNLNTPHALAGRLVRAWSEDPGRPLVLEMGIDRIGEMDELTALVRPDVGLLTRIDASHLDGLGDVATVAREKGRLLHAAARGVAAAHAWQQLDPALRAHVVPYGLDADAPWSGQVVGDAWAPRLRLSRPYEADVALPGLGAGLAESALGVLAVAHLIGVDASAAASRLSDAVLEEGRLTPRHGDGYTVLDDAYNSNPASAAQALALLRASPAPRTAVLGEMRELGSEAEARHRALGEATRGLDRVLFVGPSGEAVRAGNPDVEVIPDERAIDVVATLPRRGTILVKASRSLHFERLVNALIGGPS